MNFNELYEIESKKDYFIELNACLRINREKTQIYPDESEVFKAFEYAPLEKVKVVIIGQDPYHGPNQANGLAFSVRKGMPLPPSLLNIYKEIEQSYDIKMAKNGDLTCWAKQGVLLLNTILTVEAHKPLSHQNMGWEIFTLEVIKTLNRFNNPICFMLFGNHAKKYKSYLTNDKHKVIMTVHPSPLSAYRGFIGSGAFKSANDYLMINNLSPIDWQVR
ncbi:MAG: uracil-DNA glycosylase [Acholeplasma sp.]|nr:uracil-DNA glycosylase [Acholeplasma sp.]